MFTDNSMVMISKELFKSDVAIGPKLLLKRVVLMLPGLESKQSDSTYVIFR